MAVALQQMTDCCLLPRLLQRVELALRGLNTDAAASGTTAASHSTDRSDILLEEERVSLVELDSHFPLYCFFHITIHRDRAAGDGGAASEATVGVVLPWQQGA
jgi:hypothetical protein